MPNTPKTIEQIRAELLADREPAVRAIAGLTDAQIIKMKDAINRAA